jgi:TrmH family RNA methyltransferase
MTTGTGPLSPRNPRVTAARRLLRGRERDRQRLFLAEGPQAVREALACTAVGLDGAVVPAVTEVFLDAAGRERHPDLLAAAAAAHVPVYDVTADALASLTGTVTPQGVLAVCRSLDVGIDDALRAGPVLVSVLVQARDPGNAGTVIRASDAAGAGAVLFTEGSVDPFNGKSVRASAGSLFHLPVVVGLPVAAAVDRLRSAGMQVLAADGAGALDLDAAADAGTLAQPTAWLFGNEAWGLPADVLGLADATVRVPIHGSAESLNLAAAAVVCLYASARAQRPSARAVR